MQVPDPLVDDDDTPLPDGELVDVPLPVGAAVTLWVPSPWAPWLTLWGKRVTKDAGPEARALLLWLSRCLAALSRALDVDRGIRGVLTMDVRPAVVVADLIHLDARVEGSDVKEADPSSLSSALEPARVQSPTFCVLGVADTRADLLARTKAVYAHGTPLEVRVEDRQRVVSRRRLRVGR